MSYTRPERERARVLTAIWIRGAIQSGYTPGMGTISQVHRASLSQAQRETEWREWEQVRSQAISELAQAEAEAHAKSLFGPGATISSLIVPNSHNPKAHVLRVLDVSGKHWSGIGISWQTAIDDLKSEVRAYQQS